MKKSVATIVGLIIFICVCRVIPHLANFSPMICVALFAGNIIQKRFAVAAVLLGMLLSDILLAWVYHYPMLGSWSFFTYTGLAAILLIGARIAHLSGRFMPGLIAVLASNLGFWVWTNLGTWAFSGMYHVNFNGLITCYTAAIPFLQHSTMSAMVWYLVFLAGSVVVFTRSRGQTAFGGFKLLNEHTH